MNLFKILNLELSGSSHSDEIRLIVKNVPIGISYNIEDIEYYLNRRRPQTIFETSRIEDDEYQILGVENNKTIASTIEIIVKNHKQQSNEYTTYPRPSHADYEAYYKTQDPNSFIGGGRYSGRLTVVFCILAGIFKKYLSDKGIYAASMITEVNKVKDTEYRHNLSIEEIKYLNNFHYNLNIDYNKVLSKLRNDTYPAMIRCYLKGLPEGIGDSYFDNLKSYFSNLLFALPAVKSVSFGIGSTYLEKVGMDTLDYVEYNEAKEIVHYNNYNGGIIGGISTGSDIIVNCLVKPTPTQEKEVPTIDIKRQTNLMYQFKNRVDKCIARRIMPVVESMMLIGAFDLLLSNQLMGLVGKNISYSLSKEIYRIMGVDDYQIFDLDNEEALKLINSNDYKLLNVTIPYKKLLKENEVNNVIINNGEEKQYFNTDIMGFNDLLKHYKIDINNKKVAILGTGATSTTVKACFEGNEVQTIGRNDSLNYQNCNEVLKNADIIVNTTPVKNSSLIDFSIIKKEAIFIDVNYSPLHTQMIIEAKTNNIKAYNGLYMLVSQAYHSLELTHHKISKSIDEIYLELIKSNFNLVLIGMPGVGKTTFAKSLSEYFGMSYIDTDEEFTKRNGSIIDYFNNHSESAFREKETQIIKDLANVKSTVVSCGGGFIKKSDNYNLLKDNSFFIYLDKMPFESAFKDMIVAKDLNEWLKLKETRESLYNKYQDYTISNLEIDDLLKLL